MASAEVVLDRVGHHEDPAGLAVPADRDRGATGCLGLARAPRCRARRRGAATSRPAASADRPARRARRRCPGRRGPRRWRSPRPRRARRPAPGRRRRSARAIGCSEASSSAPASRRISSASSPGPATTSARVIWPVVTVPVLSRTIVSTRAGLLQHLRALDQDAELGAPAGADHQRGRRGQPQRARAGDDQHRYGGGERGATSPRRYRPRSRGWRPTARSRPGRRHPRSGRPAAAPRPCRSGRPRPAGPSGRAGCPRRPGWRARRADRRR